MTSNAPASRLRGLAIWLILAGGIGWYAAFALTLEKFHALTNPGEAAGCDISVLVQCTANLDSWQGSVFGFPNPIIGLAGWIVPIVVGAAILAGAQFRAWFWWGLWAGMAGAMGFVIWLIGQSIYVLGTLCPWCMVTWAVTIPTFFAVTVHVARSGLAGRPLARAFRGAMAWVPIATIIAFAVIVLLAQVRLDAITNVLSTLLP